MKSNSNDVINEMYLEFLPERIEYDTTKRGKKRVKPSLNLKPTLTLRQIPFARKSRQNTFNKRISTADEINYFIDLPRVYVKGEDIIGNDLGTSDEERYNYFLVVAVQDLLRSGSNQLMVNRFSSSSEKYPYIVERSIQRNGLRLMYLESEFALQGNIKGSTRINERLLYDWNQLVKEFYNNAVFMESGTIELKKAHPELKVGYNLVIENSTVHNNKILYIEGYTDSWVYPGNWNQSVMLTRGHYLNERGTQEILPFVIDTKENKYTGQSIVTRLPSYSNRKA